LLCIDGNPSNPEGVAFICVKLTDCLLQVIREQFTKSYLIQMGIAFCLVHKTKL
jgi:hypothetical protein